ncbi:Cyclic nucleotide-gated cation channel beta-1 [Orchesella cincta]|uniref:Cyclic nucleotide-gated cation channel beta-1 n=1 Tax=Orchesella cincta TaxID=48709 RepID=A0A1D2MQZ4_ORCCI|nr:Cyclic nucleotide-gated cation channel beta-1 [Orchesella cincta]
MLKFNRKSDFDRSNYRLLSYFPPDCEEQFSLLNFGIFVKICVIIWKFLFFLLDETRILNLLPKNMKAEIALNIHVETLAKVKLFQNCETAFLRDLVVKLRSIIILPGDFVCRKGEIGREMFIVKSGKIQVIGGASGTQVLASLGEGSVFGEIALLGIGGMNKRTADVRAAGFVNLFVLSKADLNAAIRDYPEAQEEMRKKAK